MDIKEEHIIALKVMRLTRPTLYSNPVVSCDLRDLPGVTLTSAPDVTRVADLPDLQMGEMLLLPQSFGNIYLGETFSCYLSVHNHSAEPACDVSVRAELQTGSQRLTLTAGPDGPERCVPLPPAASTDRLIHHEVKDTGSHILVCMINYTNEAGDHKSFRKFFKFEVLKPLDVKTKFYNAESDEVYLEAQIQNVTATAMCMESVSLEPSPLFDATDLNGADGGQPFCWSGRLGPQDSRQYLFCLSPRPELRTASKHLKGVTNIGKLDITWRTNLGERGRLQTSQLQRMTPGYGDLRLTIEDIPSVVELDETFDFVCRVLNASDRSLSLSLHLEAAAAGEPGLVWRGVSGRQLGQLAPGATAAVPLRMAARRLGLQTITGVRLVDAGLNRPYDYDNLAQVFVRRLADGRETL